jgi:predicted metal-dependent peptidase
MDETLLNGAARELRGLIRAVRGAAVTVIACDTEAGLPRAVAHFETLALEGGGGTNLIVGIEAAAELVPSPTLIVVLTDGETPWPTSAPRGTALLAIVLGQWAPLPTGQGITAMRIT